MRSRSSAIAVAAVLLPDRSTGLISLRHALRVLGETGFDPGRHFMADRGDDQLHEAGLVITRRLS
jgi:hypothetical protein